MWEDFKTWFLGPRCGRNGCKIRVYPKDRVRHFFDYHRSA